MFDECADKKENISQPIFRMDGVHAQLKERLIDRTDSRKYASQTFLKTVMLLVIISISNEYQYSFIMAVLTNTTIRF